MHAGTGGAGEDRVGHVIRMVKRLGTVNPERGGGRCGQVIRLVSVVETSLNGGRGPISCRPVSKMTSQNYLPPPSSRPPQLSPRPSAVYICPITAGYMLPLSTKRSFSLFAQFSSHSSPPPNQIAELTNDIFPTLGSNFSGLVIPECR